MTEPLSPSAQAVLDAYETSYIESSTESGLAAALRAAADQVVPLAPKPSDTFCCPPVDTILWNRVTNIRAELLAIAAELGAQPWPPQPSANALPTPEATNDLHS